MRGGERERDKRGREGGREQNPETRLPFKASNLEPPQRSTPTFIASASARGCGPCSTPRGKLLAGDSRRRSAMPAAASTFLGESATVVEVL